ncbi:MAG: hypothetical protein IJQ48_10225 [Prevotella sp.]|nr:hypothetical protein [Prevotella sp.]
MRKIFCLLLALLVALPFYPAQRKRVAVVLAGGGAKGTAHIGALIALKKKIGIGPDFKPVRLTPLHPSAIPTGRNHPISTSISASTFNIIYYYKPI